MSNILFRCSSLGKIMTEPKTKSEGPLSVGARTYIRSLAAQEILGIEFQVSSPQMEKGILVEQQAIELLNRVRGLDLAKNTERRSNEWLTGECDLFNAPARRGHDLKCSWSAATFPITVADCKDALYEWQMRGYMMLWDADEWEVNYALITTPEALTRWEPLFMHFVDHIPEHMRLTSWTIQRDAEKEARMVEKVKHARAYFAEVVEEFAATHQPAQTIHLLPAGAAMNDDQQESTEQDAERERIRAEEAARLEREAKAEADRLERERAHAAQVEAQRIAREQAETVSAAHIRDELTPTARAASRVDDLIAGTTPPFAGYDPKFAPGSNPEHPQTEPDYQDNGAHDLAQRRKEWEAEKKGGEA